MRWFSFILVTMVCACLGCSRSSTLTAAEFTSKFAKAVQSADATLKVEVVEDLHLKLVTPSGQDLTAFLNNAYDEYKASPSEEQAVVQKYTSALLERALAKHAPVDPTRIVPVIKDRKWLDEIKAGFAGKGGKPPEHIVDDFSADLVIVYAEDSPKSMRFLVPSDLDEAKVQREGLRALACRNLDRILPNIERRGDAGFYMLTAGGDYEASLLVLDSMWTREKMPVDGDIVVAIPSRDVLLVTGSNSAAGIAHMKEAVAKLYPNAPYRLTDKLYVFRGGRFIPFDGNPAAGPGAHDVPSPAP